MVSNTTELFIHLLANGRNQDMQQEDFSQQTPNNQSKFAVTKQSGCEGTEGPIGVTGLALGEQGLSNRAVVHGTEKQPVP